MKRAILFVAFAALCGAQTTVNGGRDFKGTLKASGSVSVVDFSGSGSTAPAKAGTSASRPTACTQGQIYFATDVAAGQNLYFCTVTGVPGVWTQMSGSAAGSMTAGTGAPAGNCAPPMLYIDTTNQDLWYCSATNTWKKPTADTSGFATAAGTNTWTGYNNFTGGQWRPPESTVANLPSASGNAGKVFMVTDAAAVGSCSSGGGSLRELCRANGTSYECVGGCGSGGGGGSGTTAYISSLMAGPDSTRTVTGGTHGFATTALLVGVYDNASPRNAISAGWTVHPTTYDVAITFASPQSNYYVVINGGAGPAGPAGAAGPSAVGGAGAVQTSNGSGGLADGGCTMTSGTVTCVPIGGLAGTYSFSQGTTNVPPNNSVGFQAPTSVPAAYLVTMPSVPAAGYVKRTNANPSVESVGAIANADLPTAALAGVLKYTAGVPTAIGTSSTNCVHEDGSSGACSGGGGTVNAGAGSGPVWIFGPAYGSQPVSPAGAGTGANKGVRYQFTMTAQTESRGINFRIVVAAGAGKAFAAAIYSKDLTTIVAATASATDGGTPNINTTGAARFPWVSGSLVTGGVLTLPAGSYWLLITSDTNTLTLQGIGTNTGWEIANATTTTGTLGNSYGYSTASVSTGTGAGLAFIADLSGVSFTGTSVQAVVLCALIN